MKTIRLILCCGLISSSLLSQTNEGRRFFPSSVGNKWRWYDQNSLSTFDTEITHDSTGPDGSLYLFYDGATGPHLRIDTLNHVYTYLTGWESILWYNLDAANGDTFLTWNDQFKVVVSVWNSSVFGIPTIFKQFTWYSFPTNIWYGTQYLARDFGLVESHAIIGPVDQTVTGCIIDGIGFGTLAGLVDHSRPSHTALYQNYPNPFNPSTVISYQLSVISRAVITIYNALGREVRTLVDGMMPKGHHRVIWDGRDRKGNLMPSGVYLCQFQAGPFIAVRKMLMMR